MKTQMVLEKTTEETVEEGEKIRMMIFFDKKKLSPAFVSDLKKPKRSIITCGTCHCSGNSVSDE